MRANLAAAGGLPLAEHVAALLAPAVGAVAAQDLVAAAAARAAGQGVSLAEALIADQDAAAALREAGIDRDDLDAAVEPANYLGASAEFIARALAAHARFHPVT
jgi:3-carboxy-cis,cis-muconate cycloisomerase